MAAKSSSEYEDLHRAHYRAVLAYARRRTSAAEADDIVAETFATAWQAMDRVPLEPLPWLLAIARNKVLHHRRAQARRDALTERLVDEMARIEPNVERVDSEVLVALSKLPERDREVVLLVCWDGRQVKEAAMIMGSSYIATRARLYRSRKRLTELLSPSVQPVRAKEAA